MAILSEIVGGSALAQYGRDISSSSHTPFTEDLVRKRQRPRSHFMPVDVFGAPVYAGSAPRNQVRSKDRSRLLCRTQDVDDFLLRLSRLHWMH